MRGKLEEQDAGNIPETEVGGVQVRRAARSALNSAHALSV
jgi:hypothetical protein